MHLSLREKRSWTTEYIHYSLKTDIDWIHSVIKLKPKCTLRSKQSLQHRFRTIPSALRRQSNMRYALHRIPPAFDAEAATTDWLLLLMLMLLAAECTFRFNHFFPPRPSLITAALDGDDGVLLIWVVNVDALLRWHPKRDWHRIYNRLRPPLFRPSIREKCTPLLNHSVRININ